MGNDHANRPANKRPSRRQVLRLGGLALLGTAGAAAEKARARAKKVKLKMSFPKGDSITAGELLTVLIQPDPDFTNPARIGFSVYDRGKITRPKDGKKWLLRQCAWSNGTLAPGQSVTLTYRPALTDSKDLILTIIGWDKEHPPAKGDDPKDFRFLDTHTVKFK